MSRAATHLSAAARAWPRAATDTRVPQQVRISFRSSDKEFGGVVFEEQKAHCGLVRLPDVPAERRVELMETLLQEHLPFSYVGGRDHRARRPRAGLAAWSRLRRDLTGFLLPDDEHVFVDFKNSLRFRFCGNVSGKGPGRVQSASRARK